MSAGAISHHVDPPPSGKNKARKYDYKIRFVAAVFVCLEYMKRDPLSMNPCALIIRFLGVFPKERKKVRHDGSKYGILRLSKATSMPYGKERVMSYHIYDTSFQSWCK